MADYTRVQMDIKETTLKKVEKLAKTLDSTNRTSAVVTAIDIANMVATALKEGGRVIIETEKGDKYQINIDGMKK